MFASKAAFKRGIESGEVKTMTLVEYQTLQNGQFVNKTHRFSGVKRPVVSANTVSIQLGLEDGQVSHVDWNSEFEFSGHRLTITDEDTILTYIVNPLW